MESPSSIFPSGSSARRAETNFRSALRKALSLSRVSSSLPARPWVLGAVLAAVLVAGISVSDLRASTIFNSGNTFIFFDTDFGTNLTVADTGTATLVISNSGVLATDTNGWIGEGVGSVGTATVRSGTWANSDNLTVGHFGTGTLNVTGGSVTNSYGWIGSGTGGVGTATITSGTWANSGELNVGFNGSGGLSVRGGYVSNSDCYLGRSPNGEGWATVSSGTWANSGDLTVGDEGTGTLNVSGGSVTNIDGVLGSIAGSVGTATVSSGTWANSRGLYVGKSGTGTLNVTGGSVTNTNGYIGDAGVGTATVSSGTWANSGELNVGESRQGTLNVAGGLVTNRTGCIGNSAGSVGTATVSSGTWANSSNLTVGDQGTGTLNVSGGSVTNTNGYIGLGVGTGTANVSSGTWANSGELNVGFFGSGGLSVRGGYVSNSDCYLGRTPNSDGWATVSSGTWANSGRLRIGYEGIGWLTVSGGYVSNTDCDISWAPGSVGIARVTSGTWANSGALYVGGQGRGTLTISGGLVIVGGRIDVRSAESSIDLNSGGTLQIGAGGADGVLGTDLINNGTLIFNRSDAWTYLDIISGTGAVTKQGAGTLTLTDANSYSGLTTITAGTLQIGNGGTTGSIAGTDLINNGTLIFNRSNASTYSGIISGTGAVTKQGAGTLTLTGTSALPNAIVTDHTLNVQTGTLAILASGTGNLIVGNSGTGTLNVSGGRVTNTTGYLGRNDDSVGTATITSGTWANSGALGVGFYGTGTLNVSGGSVTNTTGYLGYNADSKGTATVSSGTWANDYQLYVGYSGTGTLNVSGGRVTSDFGYIGLAAGSKGTATVSSGTWANSDNLYLGLSGTGTLTVSGGSVTSVLGSIGFYAGSVGTATVSSGTWANSGDLFVGDAGTGTLTMSGGLVTVGGTLSKGALGTINLNAGGTLQIGVGTTGGDLGIDLINNGTLIFNRSDASTYSGIISGTGAVTKQGAGTLTLAGANSYSGGTRIWSGTISVVAGGSINHSSADLIVGQSFGRTGTLNVSGGRVTSDSGYIGRYDGAVAGSVGTATVSSGTWANRGSLYVGYGGTGTLNVTGGSVTNTVGYLGIPSTAGGVGTATVSSGTWANSSELGVGLSGTGTLNVTGGSVTNTNGYLGYDAGSVGTATVSSGTWANSIGLIVGRSGTGTLNVSGGRVTSDDGFIGLAAGSKGTATVSSGTWANSGPWFNSGKLYVGGSGTGTLNVTGGSVTNVGNGYIGDAAGSVGTATVSSGTWANSGNLTVGRSGTGTLTMSGGLVAVGGTLSKGAYGTINLNSGGTLQIGTGTTGGVLGTDLINNGTLIFNRSDASTYSGTISGTGAITNVGTGTTTLTSQTSFAAPFVATAGRLIVGNAASVNGFSTSGNLTAATGGTLELKSRGLAYVNGLSTLIGSTILATNGISLGAGANVVGAGLISGRVAASYGSRIEASGGTLTAGDALSYAGFNSDGELYTNANEVELLDRNLAVLGSLSQLGDVTGGGTLRAANGMLLEQGKNLVGRGTVYGDFVNQGDVYGDGLSLTQRIVFAAGSTVSGIGSFENVVFDGTYSPGNSPAITHISDGMFGASSTLLIELGGTQPGTQYDRVIDSGTLILLGGTLEVILYNGFVPSYGDSFEILQYEQLSGDFGTFTPPALGGNLSWTRITSATAMTIVVIPEPSTAALVAIGAGLAGLMQRRKRRAG